MFTYASLLNVIFRTVVQHLTRFELTLYNVVLSMCDR